MYFIYLTYVLSKINKIVKVKSEADLKAVEPNVEAMLTMLSRRQEQFLAAKPERLCSG